MVVRVVCSSSTSAIAIFLPRTLCFWPVALRYSVHTSFVSCELYAVGQSSELLPSRFELGASRHTTYHDLATLPSEGNQRAQPRARSSAASARPPIAENQVGKEASLTEPATGQRPTQAQSGVQEEGSGYLSTESDSDTGTNKKTQVCC